MADKENPGAAATAHGDRDGQDRDYPITDAMRPATSRRMRLLDFRPMSKGALRGFASVELPNGMQINDCAVCVSNGKAWAALPAKPVLDRDGQHVEKDGKKQYAAVLRWADRATADRWSAAVVDLVSAAHPGVLP